MPVVGITLVGRLRFILGAVDINSMSNMAGSVKGARSVGGARRFPIASLTMVPLDLIVEQGENPDPGLSYRGTR